MTCTVLLTKCLELSYQTSIIDQSSYGSILSIGRFIDLSGPRNDSMFK